MASVSADSERKDGDPLAFAEVLDAEQRIAGCRPPGESAGLAFSGGGIRSATFNLGVIQALAEFRLLQRFDYLSTVSGGGYIGSWLTALIHRRAGGDAAKAEELIAGTQAASASGQAAAKGISGGDAIREDEAIRWLRAYSNYITPRLGLLGGDAQAAISTWLRNFLLNMTVLAALLATLLVIPRLLQRVGELLAGWQGFASVYEILVLALSIPAVLMVSLNLVRDTSGSGSAGARPWYTRGKVLVWVVIVPIMTVAWLGAEYLRLLARDHYAHFKEYDDAGLWMTKSAVAYGLMWFVSLLACASLRRSGKHGPRDFRILRERGLYFLWWCVKFVVFAALAGMLWGLLLKWSADWLGSLSGNAAPWVSFVAGPPLFVAVVLTVVMVHIGLMARNFSDQHHEFWSRIGGQFQVAILAWLIVTGLAAFSAPLIEFLAAWAAGGGIAWLVTSLAGVWFGKSAATSGEGSKGWREIVTRVAPYVFVVGFLGLVAWGIQKGFTAYGEEKGWFAGTSCESGRPGPASGGEPGIQLRAPQETGAAVTTTGLVAKPGAVDRFSAHLRYQSCLMGGIPFAAQLLALCLLVFLTLILGWRININLYSIHKFYRNRLMRCYLGATNERRRPNPVTGFDPDDDIELKDLNQKPYHIINTAINLNSGRQLAWQRRRAASFTFTPLYTGYEPASRYFKAGYRQTSRYAVDETTRAGVQVGTAVAASGAAASPNQGFHTNPAVAFLLTVFDVRIGRWCGDTGHESAWKEEDPTFSLRYWIAEMTGQADTNLPFVYLSDGGHFENLGIYELVRRRCRLIVACDAGADSRYIFDDIGEAIRKCYIDFGVEITIDVGEIVPVPDGRTGRSALHYALGEIHYERALNPSPMGRLIYIKSSVTKDLPTDLRHYKSEHPEFPHQSTADQFFDEAQFESYRKLGYQAARDSIAHMEQNGKLPPELARSAG